ncbi:MAG: type II secretion system protein [Candidatus Omnitrophota bacterium]|nr:MAG: type II secretion system protein [Candidatus Omnitrophota bacterium]
MKKIKGFTLVELLIGVIIIAITSVAAFEFFRHCRRFIVETELRLGAANFARETIEVLDWNTDITDTTGWQNDRDLPTGEEFGSSLRDEYEGSRLYRIEDGATSGYKKISVKVTWEP